MYFFLPRFAIKRFRAKHSLLYASKHIQYIYYIYIYISLFVVFRSLFRCFRFLFIFFFLLPTFPCLSFPATVKRTSPFRDTSWATERSKSDHFPHVSRFFASRAERKRRKVAKVNRFSPSPDSITRLLRALQTAWESPRLFVLSFSSFFPSLRPFCFSSRLFLRFVSPRLFFLQAWTRLFAKYFRSPRSFVFFFFFLSFFLSLSRKRALSYALASRRPKKKIGLATRLDHTLSSPFSHIVLRTDRGGL